MQFIDVLRMQSLDTNIMISKLWHDSKGMIRHDETKIMKVGNLKWDRLRRFEYLNVCKISPGYRNGKEFLFIQVDDREKNFYNRS